MNESEDKALARIKRQKITKNQNQTFSFSGLSHRLQIFFELSLSEKCLPVDLLRIEVYSNRSWRCNTMVFKLRGYNEILFF